MMDSSKRQDGIGGSRLFFANRRSSFLLVCIGLEEGVMKDILNKVIVELMSEKDGHCRIKH